MCSDPIDHSTGYYSTIKLLSLWDRRMCPCESTSICFAVDIMSAIWSGLRMCSGPIDHSIYCHTRIKLLSLWDRYVFFWIAVILFINRYNDVRLVRPANVLTWIDSINRLPRKISFASWKVGCHIFNCVRFRTIAFTAFSFPPQTIIRPRTPAANSKNEYFSL
jgi:hypothetical protein